MTVRGNGLVLTPEETIHLLRIFNRHVQVQEENRRAAEDGIAVVGFNARRCSYVYPDEYDLGGRGLTCHRLVTDGGTCTH